MRFVVIMSGIQQLVEPKDIDSSFTEFSVNSRGVAGGTRNVGHPFSEQLKNALTKLKCVTIRQNLSSNNLKKNKFVECQRIIDVCDPDIRFPRDGCMQRELVARAAQLDETSATTSVIQTENNGDTQRCYTVNLDTSDVVNVEENSETHRRSYASVLAFDKCLDDRHDQISGQGVISEQIITCDSPQSIKSCTPVTEVGPKVQSKCSSLTILKYSPPEGTSVREKDPTQLGQSSAGSDATSARTFLESQDKHPVQGSTRTCQMPCKSKNNHYQKSRFNVNTHVCNGVAAEDTTLSMPGFQRSDERITRGREKEIQFVANIGSKVDFTNEWILPTGGNVNGNNRSTTSGSQGSKWQDGYPHKIESETIVDEDLDGGTDQTTQECDSSSDIEDMICGLREFKSHKSTSSSSARRLFVGHSGSWFDGDVDGKNMSGFGTLFSSDKRQFVQGMWLDNQLINLHSCQFTDQGADECTIHLIKQANSYLLTFDKDEFVARAQLCSSHAADFTSSFRKIKSFFFRNLTVTKVIDDRLQSDRESALIKFKKALEYVVHDAASPVNFAVVLITLRKFLKENSSRAVLIEITENVFIPDILRMAAGSLLENENMLSNRRMELLMFSRDTQPPKLKVESVVRSVYTDATTFHRKSLIEKCPSCLPKLIASISELTAEKIIYVSKADIEVFHHLASLTKEHDVLAFFDDLHHGLFEKLAKVDSSCSPSDVMPLSAPVLGFLFKSFLEIVSEISVIAENCSIVTMLTKNKGEWKLLDKICWNQDIKQSKRMLLTQESLECQYRFIFKLMCHFEPKHYSHDEKFNYDIRVVNREDSDGPWLVRQFKKVRNIITAKTNLTDMPEDRQVWLYILDHTIDKVLVKNNPDSKSCLELFKPMLDGHVTFLSRCPTNSYESFRVVTRNILMFMIQTYPHFQDTEKLTDRDFMILEKQMKCISNVSTDMKSDALASSDFRNLIDEYNRYWGLRHLVTLDDPNCPQYLVSLIKETHEVLLRLVDTSLEKTVQVSTLVSYFRELNDFMEDFKDIDFLSMWYIKSNSNRANTIEKIENKIATERKCSYKVIDLKRFVEGCKDVPRHHIIHIVQTLLECAIECLSKNWVSTCDQSVAQLEGTGALLGAIRSSFLYLKEQPDYRDFELFSNESVQPFLRVVNNCTVLEEFKIRMNVVKESFWYIRKMDEIGIVQAMELFNTINNGALNIRILKQCYDRYLVEYNEFISNANSENFLEDVKCIVSSMKDNYKDFDGLEDWGDDFKNDEVPKILAGLSAVWSLLVSKDVSSSGKFLKPHCIQILCVMRLLSVDNTSPGVEHHLAQVLTGQGKSVILGLLSAFLAFTGYEVRVLCYSNYLAKRDEKDFNDFFKAFGLAENISYGTFDEMATELFLKPEFDGQRISLWDFVESLVLEHRSWKALGSPTSNLSKTVLLIDEVDVFFSKNVYGSTYHSGVDLKIPGLSQIQEKIWKTVCGSNYEQQALYSIIQEFIDEGIRSGNEELKEYNKFRLKPGNFSLLGDGDDGNLITKEFTNRSLLEEHLKKMVQQAIVVSKGNHLEWHKNNRKIIDGLIHGRNSIDGVFKRYIGYGMIFNYFRIKEADFDHKDFLNYGYINLSVGRISYAKLPEEFPLILGVSGTLSNLSDYENESIKSYDINSFSILPSFFGESNLNFNRIDNFCIMNSMNDWGRKIFEHANKAIERQRSVLVFFDTESKLEYFQKDYGNKFDRLNVLTEDTNDYMKAKHIDEAGIASTVTLATRMMGRGVDFKSSMAVEKKGGVHVIQTFFSLDVKEETQIKGRTARKDNRGSYELILCKPHLNEVGLLKNNGRRIHNYKSLHQTRLELMNIEGAKNAEKIKKSEKNHNLTMDFYGIGARR